MKTIYQLQQIADRLRQVTESNSIGPEDVFGLQADILEYMADMEQSSEGLGISSVYASYQAMAQDSAPMGSNGKPLRFGQLVTIYDPENTSQAESGNVYAWQKGNADTPWKLVGNLTRAFVPDGSITTPKIADGAVTAGKVSPLCITLKTEYGSLDADGEEESFNPDPMAQVYYERTRMLRLAPGAYTIATVSTTSAWLYRYRGNVFVSRTEIPPAGLSVTVKDPSFAPVYGEERFDSIRISISYGNVQTLLTPCVKITSRYDLLAQSHEYETGEMAVMVRGHERRMAVADEFLARPLHDLIMAADPRPSGDPNKLTYNATTGYYEMNGLTDLTYAEILKIYSQANLASTPFVGWSMFIHGTVAGIRTNFPYASQGWGDMFDDLSLKGCCSGANDMEVLILISGDWGNPIYDANGNAIEGVSDRPVKIGDATWFFNGASASSDNWAIKRILTPIINDSPNTFLYAGAPPSLEDIFIITSYDVPKILSGSPNISYESIRFLINRATNTSAITVEVHPTVYAKLQSSGTWSDLYTLAQTKNISFTTVTNS